MSAKNLLRWLAACLAALICPWVQAQLLDDTTLRREGSNAVIEVKFVVPVRLQRAITTDASDLSQVLYDVLDPLAALSFNLAAGQRRVVSGGAGLPRITISDEAVVGTVASRRLVLRFDRPSRISVRTGRGDRVIEIVLEGLGADVTPPTPVSTPEAPAGNRGYLITLISSRDPNVQMDLPVPSALQDYQVFTENRVVGGQALHEINLGYFTTLPEAQNARNLLLRRFPKATIVSLADRAANNVAAASPAAPGASAVPPPPPASGPRPELTPAVPPEKRSEQAVQLLVTAKAALDKNDYDTALSALNQLLDLPNNPISREAQELIGYVRLRAGDTTRARKEFELFVKLYPEGPDTDRVREKLASLPKTEPGPDGKRPPAATPSTLTFNGSLSERFFGAKSQVDDGTGGNVGFADDAKRADTDVDMNLRYKDADRDMRLVFRDAYFDDLLNSDRSRNKLSAAYADYRSFSWGTNIRLGRQTPTGGGVFGTFDGVQAGYLFLPKWRINVVGGVPVDQILDSKTQFYGVSVDAEALTPNLSASWYLLQQQTDGLTDRRALGTEMRYFNGGVSVSGVLDYDQFIGGLNFLSVQASYQMPSNTAFNFFYDYRAQPSSVLALSNTLFTQDPTLDPAVNPRRTRLEDLVKDLGVGTLRDRVIQTTGYSTQILMGATTPINKNWQLGADVRYTNIGAIDPVDAFNFPGQEGSGNLYSASTQLIGSNLYSSRDTHVFSVAVISGQVNALSLAYNNSSAVGEWLLVEPSLQFFIENDGNGGHTNSLSPGLRLTFQLGRHFSLESELNYEYRKLTASDGSEETDDDIFYIFGARIDF